ncbi:hypothetical protein PHLGIDRAFT_36550 [Phlebiopsis gigantea 11061_1 CR5-6]|uniref:Uncharacterized protein n=1 Tax=Phlebiopsis gigantea (strain 11061_1 CR5-6) TaxID=745531 RepID=A0A0C3NJX5_PHLG1|nr:hypothetical protein PHLGIDRAFT_36550 [Phlebiopsis gigantea 11061_1 CR5-6]
MFRSGSLQSTKSSTSNVSRRYRESTHLIPTPGVDQPRPQRHAAWPLSTWKVLTVAVFMVLLGVGIEIALAFSQRNDGFPVPQNNALSFVQPSFLTAFFPTLLVFPLSYLWGVADRVLRWYQPYVVLSRGGVRAEDSLMIDYVMSNIIVSLWRTLRRREWIIHISMVSALVATLYQPLAGALLSIRQVYMPHDTYVTSTTTLDLASDVATLNSFLTAAGFVEAAAFLKLPDPPFIRGGWAVSQLTASSDEGLNASITALGTGVSLDSGCSVPSSIVLNTDNSNSYSINATDSDGCSSVASFNPVNSDQQYGTTATSPGTCGLDASTPVDFVPVMFWFFHSANNGTGQARAIICRPTLELANVKAEVYLVNNSLLDVQSNGHFTKPNNITGSPLNGRPYNGVIFTQTNMNEFVKARAVAIQSQIPGAIFRYASQNSTLLQQFFDSSVEFLPLTKRIYTQHLAVSALSVYFVSQEEREGAVATSLVERLVMDTLAAHALAALMIVIGLTGVALHLCHRHVRRRLYLTAAPGTIASAVALTSHSGFGELLYPYDDEQAIRAKLASMRFSLDRRTGAIVADEYVYDEEPVHRQREGAADKLELQSVLSRTPLVREGAQGGSSPDLRNVQELPYEREREPLVSRFEE